MYLLFFMFNVSTKMSWIFRDPEFEKQHLQL